jgi:hypothetical protein
MFCPNCKAEYLEGYTSCVDCRIPLVDLLPEEEDKTEPEKKFVKILQTNNLTDVVLLKSLLEGGEIRYFIQNDNMSVIYPFIQPATLMVMEDDVEKTLDLLKDVKLNYCMIFSKNP